MLMSVAFCILHCLPFPSPSQIYFIRDEFYQSSGIIIHSQNLEKEGAHNAHEKIWNVEGESEKI